jgi:hypothetical protein
MIHYERPRKSKQGAIYQVVGGALGIAMLGFVNVATWRYFLLVGGDWIELLVFGVSMVIPCALVLMGCRQCIDITARQDGLIITTCLFFKFFIPWEKITGLRIYEVFSVFKKIRQRTAISISSGLTPIHRVWIRSSQGWRWVRGFEITLEAKGYSDLLSVIKEHINKETNAKEVAFPNP